MSALSLRSLFVTALLLLCFSCNFTARGRADGAFLVKDIYPGLRSGSPDGMFSVNNTVFFRSYCESVYGVGFWKSDGTPQGTVMLRDASPMNFAKLGNLVVFISGNVPYRSDGTAAGTFALSSGIGAYTFLCVNDVLFFQYSDRDSSRPPPWSLFGSELWRSDGTPANTYMVKDINPGTADSYAAPVADVNGVLFLYADDGVHGMELWKSDGTEAGTVLVKDINPGASGSMNTSPYGTYAEFQGQFFFAATDGIHGYELWKSDGTASGTVMVKDMNLGSAGGFINQTGEFTKAGGKLFFRATDGVHGIELWVSDGTEQGTHVVRDINPGPDSGYGYNLVALRDFLCFTAYSPDYGYELWRSDGTEGGTYLVKDTWPGPSSGWPTVTVYAQGRIYFRGNDGVYGPEVWTSDGTPEGTFRLTDIVPGPGGSYPIYFADANGLLLFAADDGILGGELWAIPLLPVPKAPASAQSAWWRRY
jgi:ELWxxDGT repeat protein